MREVAVNFEKELNKLNNDKNSTLTLVLSDSVCASCGKEISFENSNQLCEECQEKLKSGNYGAEYKR